VIAASNTAHTVTISVIGFVLLVAVIVVWRILIHDSSIRKVRFGVFYERLRDQDEDPDERHERLARKDERP
jgi:hypothetical protein